MSVGSTVLDPSRTGAGDATHSNFRDFNGLSKDRPLPSAPTLSGLAVERTLQLAGEVRHGLRDPFPFPFLSSLALE